MVSLQLQAALERDVVGQTRAVTTITRTVTIALSGLANPDSPLGIYLLVGPSGTGKTHLARSLARRLHGDTRRLVVADCAQLSGRNEGLIFARQIAPFFGSEVPEFQGQVRGMAPLSILLIERLERARPEFVEALVAVLESGSVPLPDGKCGSLRGCLVLLTSGLCSREIYEAGRPEIGFSPASDIEESEKARIYQQCAAAAEKRWGTELLSHIDDLIVFHRLGPHHLPHIVRRLEAELNRRLATLPAVCSLDRDAARFLEARAGRFLRHGAWVLVKAFRRFVVFPLADLASSGRLAPGSRVRIGIDGDDRLRFTVDAGNSTTPPPTQPTAGHTIPIEWRIPGIKQDNTEFFN